jgi:UDP-glucose 4-epimerase
MTCPSPQVGGDNGLQDTLACNVPVSTGGAQGKVLAPDETHWRACFDGAKVLITGGVGLIGSALARRLASFGSDVVLVDSLDRNFGGNVFNIRDIETSVKVSVSDVRDVNGLHTLLHDREFVFNLAAQTSHMDSMSAPFEDLEINCSAQLALMEACRRLETSPRIVFASTRQVYGKPHYLPVDERHPVRPVDVNGINKVAGESYHLLYHDVYRLPTTVLRLTNTYGPGMRVKDARQIFLGVWVRRILEGEPFELWGGEQRRDFTYVDDAADAFIAAACSEQAVGGLFNVGGSEVVTLRRLAEMLVAQNGSGAFDVREFPAERKLIDIGDYYTDDSAFRTATGWAPKVDLAQGLARTLEFYRANIAQYL